ncbi:MFS transporter [Chloroflexota bacterium]
MILGRLDGIFYGWRIVGIGFTILALAGGTFFQGFILYFLPLSRDLGLSRTATSLPFALARFEAGVGGPPVGYLIDRFGSGRVLFAGSLLAGVGFIVLSSTHNYAAFLAVFLAMMGLGFSASGSSLLAAMNQWFVRRRGVATSIIVAGSSTGGMVIAPAIAVVISHLGWRIAALVSGLAILAVVVPLSTLVKRSPESIGLLPDGDTPIAGTISAPQPGSQTSRGQASDYAVKEALRTPSFWLLSTSNGLRNGILAGVIIHLVPIMTWKGLEETTAGLMVGVLSFGRILFGLLGGVMGDLWSKQRVIGLSMVVGTFGLLLILVLPQMTIWQMVLVLLLLSASEGVGPMSWILIGDFFGRRSFGTLRGFMAMIQSPFSFGMPILSGWVYDATQSYMLAVAPFSVLLFLSAIGFWVLRQPVKRRASLQAE